MSLSKNNIVVLEVLAYSELFKLSALFDRKDAKWDLDVALTVYPFEEKLEFWDNTDFLEGLYNTLKAQMDYKTCSIGYVDENEYIQTWFETFSTRLDIFTISDEFIDAWEDMQKLIGNEK